MLYYFDSSAAVKRYASEQGSEWVKSIAETAEGNTLYLSQVGIVEIAAALSRKVRTGELDQEEYKAALRLFLIDHFVKRCGMDFYAFEQKIEAQEFLGVEAQEDYHDWYFWRESKQRAEDVLRNLRQSVKR